MGAMKRSAEEQSTGAAGSASGSAGSASAAAPDSKRIVKSKEIIEGLIGSGTYGEVYKVLHEDSGQCKAIKIIARPKKALDYQDIAREIYGLYNSGNLQQILVGSGNRVGLAMPLMGQRLGNSIVPKLTVPRAVQLLKPIAQSLAQLKGMHRDVKPANILWPKDSHSSASLIDFSLATYQDSSKDHAVVTLWYRAPEILLKMKYTNAVDVWSLGIILLNVLTGAHVSRILQEDQAMFMLLNVLDAFGWPNDWPEFVPSMIQLFHQMPTLGPSCGTYDILKAILDNNSSEHAALAYDLLKGMLQVNPAKRSTWSTVLEHPLWRVQCDENNSKSVQVSETLDCTASHFVTHAVRINSSVDDSTEWSTPKHLRGPLVKHRVFEMDYLLHYGKKMKFSIDTCLLAYFINVKVLAAPESDNFESIATKPFVIRLAACLFLASSFNEDTRVEPIDLAMWAFMWDEPGFFNLPDAIIGVLMKTQGQWPRGLETFKTCVHGQSFGSFYRPWMIPFLSIFTHDEFEEASKFLHTMNMECSTSISNTF